MTIYYIDFNRGSDSNSGTSPSAPWKNLSKIAAVTAAAAGDAFLLADDSEWALTPSTRVVPPTTWTGAQHNPVVIGKYSPSSQSTGQRPLIICNVETVASDWTWDATLDGDGKARGWKYLYPTAHINRAVLIRINDSWLASTHDFTGKAANTAPEDIDGRFNVGSDNQTVYLYSPQTINPVDYYGKVVVSAQASGAITLSSGRKWVTVQDIAFTESGCGVLLYSQDALEAGFIVERCLMQTGGSLVVANAASPGNLRAWIRNNEVYDFGAVGIHANSIGGAGISYMEINGNRVANGVRSWAQAGIYIQVRNAARDGICKVLYNDISGCRWGTQGKSLDGSGIYLETGADGVLVAGNVIHDQYCAIQDNSGRRNILSGNLVYDCRLGVRVSDQSGNNQSDHRSYNNTFIVGDERQTPTEFGSAQGQEYPGYWMYKTASTLNVTAKNNLFLKSGASRGRAVFGLPDVYATSTYDLSGNWVYGFEADSLKASDNSAATPPSGAIANAGTSDPSPYLNTDHSLKTTIPIGGIPMPNPLRNAGTYVQGVTLRNGRTQPGMTPIGAHQVGRY